jgi:hypothetical protein
MRKATREKLESLKTTDIYSLILFALFKLKEDPEYSTLSELAYLLDKDSLFNLLDYYGGLTIKIPTAKEFKTVINALLLYQYVNSENIEFNEAFRLLDMDYQTKEVRNCYFKIVEILEKYNFERN